MTCLVVLRVVSGLEVEQAGLGLLEGCLGRVQEMDSAGRSEEAWEGRCQVSLVVILELTENCLRGSRECRLSELSRLDSVLQGLGCVCF